MNICLTCGSYLNLYCPHDEATGIWTCSICQAKNAALETVFHSAAFYCNIVEYRQTAAEAVSDGGDHRQRDRDHHGDRQRDIIEEPSNANNNNDPIMIVLDANLPPKEVAAILKHTAALHLQNVGLVIFSNMIHVYQIGLKGIASADVYSPTLHPIDSGVEVGERMYFGSWDQVEYCANVYFGTSGFESEIYTRNSIKKPVSRQEMLKLKREARLQKETDAKCKHFDGFDSNKVAELIMAARARNKHKSQRECVRCTGEAAAYAVHLINAMESQTGRVIMFTNGCCNIGKGSVVANDENDNGNSIRRGDVLDPERMQNASEYLYSLGEEAFTSGVGIDVFCSGNSALGAQALLALVKSSGGYVLNHSCFEDDVFNQNVKFVCGETCMSRASSDNTDVDAVGLRMASPHRMNLLNGVVVDLRMPRYVESRP